MKFLYPEELKKFYISYPNTVAIVSVYSPQGKVNFMSVVWQTQLSFAPPLHGVWISPKRYTHGLILEAKKFGIAFYPFEKKDVFVIGGRYSGKDTDKVKLGGFNVLTGKILQVPLIEGFYAAFECELKDIVNTGDHDLFVGEIKGIHLDQDVFKEDGITPLGAKPTMYLGGNRFITVDYSTLIKVDPDEIINK